jgi:RNA polymerase primary sigma factor
MHLYKTNHEILSAEEERQLLQTYFNAKTQEVKDKALQTLIEKNLRLVLNSAMTYLKYTQVPGACYELDDLVQEGIIGLIQAVKKFDLSRNTRFSTYAKWWIDYSIQRSLYNNNYAIRVPVNKISKLTEDTMPIVYSFDTPIGNDEDSKTYEEYISEHEIDEVEDIIFDHIEKTEKLALLQQALPALSDKERACIILRFGLEEEVPHTLEEISQKLNISREGARQIESRALNKLKKILRKMTDTDLSQDMAYAR